MHIFLFRMSDALTFEYKSRFEMTQVTTDENVPTSRLLFAILIFLNFLLTKSSHINLFRYELISEE